MFTRVLQRLRGSAGPTWVEPEALRRRLRRGEMHMVIDVRTPEEFDGELGHIPGALNVPLAALAARSADLADAGLPIVLVCLTDKRSSQAAAELAAAGARDIAVLCGGMKAWRAGEGAV
jgi:rhodanese-related sulfurtransferase